jgi:hypothetical protein
MPASIGAVSFNGLTWKKVLIPCNNPTMTGAWTGITYANNKFVTVSGIAGDGATAVAVSSDGINWKSGTLPSPQVWWRIAGGNGKFVAITSGNYSGTTAGSVSNVAAVSSDGLHWTQITLPVSNYWQGITFGNGLFVMVGLLDVSLFSSDGKNWTIAKVPTNNLEAITYGNGVFVATSCCMTCSTSVISSDAVHWNVTTLPVGGNWNAITFGKGLFVASGLVSNAQGGIGAVSFDGINWNETVLPSVQDWNAIAYGNNSFIALSSIYGIVAKGSFTNEENTFLFQ